MTIASAELLIFFSKSQIDSTKPGTQYQCMDASIMDGSKFRDRLSPSHCLGSILVPTKVGRVLVAKPTVLKCIDKVLPRIVIFLC